MVARDGDTGSWPVQFTDVFARFQQLEKPGHADEWVCLCPAHGDKRPSLTVTLSEDRSRLLLWCRRNCPIDEICAGLGIKTAQLFAGGEREWVKPRITATYRYLDESGVELFQVVRQEWVRDGQREKTFRQRHRVDGQWVWSLAGVRRVVYRLPELLANSANSVCVVEGEKDVERLRRHGFTATCNPCGAGKWLTEYGQWLKDRRVAIIADNDVPGIQHAADVAGSAMTHGAASIRVVQLPVGPKGDVSDFLDSGGTKQKLLSIIKATPEYRLTATV